MKCIQSFLINHQKTVLVDGIPSILLPVVSGVPQESVLGLLIFLILIGKIDDEVEHSSAKSFADDTRVIKGVENVDDTQKLQAFQYMFGLMTKTWSSTALSLS